jgi:hypothetical protein
MTPAKTTTKPALPSLKILRAFCDSSNIKLSPQTLRKEFEEKLAAKDGSGGLRFSFSQLDESICSHAQFLTLVEWLWHILPDDAQRTADLTEAFYCAIAFDHASASLWLIAKDAIDINDAMTFDEGTVLGVAAGRNRPKAVEALLEKGCNPNTISPMGYTPLFELLIALPHPEPSPSYVLLYEYAIQTAMYLVDAGAKREIMRNGKKERAVDMAQGKLKEWLHGLDEASVLDDVTNPGTPPKKPKQRGP